jgi:pimeloyl-ACP methyl ester carboxylesterase
VWYLIKRIKRLWWVPPALLILVGAFFVLWASSAAKPMPEALAANFARRNPEAVSGLVLWAAYPASNDVLSDYQLATVSIYGTRDGLATPEEIDASRQLLPSDTQWIATKGGNHAPFGWYGPQAGDNEATISREEQQARVSAATCQLLQRLGE